MKKGIIRLLAKYLGLEKALVWVNGRKSYVAGAGLILAGVAEVLAEAAPVLGTQDPSAILAFLTVVASHPGVQKVLEGVAVMGLRHAVEKSAK